MKKNKGFTVLELLIVVAIIGMLSSIVFVAIKQSKCVKSRTCKTADDDSICEMYRWRSISHLPVNCLKYFNVQPQNLTTLIHNNNYVK